MVSSTSDKQGVAAAVVRGRDILADALDALDVSTVFGVMGDGNLPWLSVWAAREGNEFISARHESGAVAMADGAGWHSHRPGVSTVTYGPGVLNAMNALATAHRGGAGHVLITATPGPSRPHHPQRYDHESLIRALGATYMRVTSVERIGSSLADAFGTAAATGVLVVVDIDEQCFDRTVADGVGSVQTATKAPADTPSDASWLPEVEKVIADAAQPLLIAGIGAERAGAAEAMIDLAESTGAWLATTLPTRGLFAGHSHYLGNIGGFATVQARPVMDQCDVVVAFGASLNEFTTDNERLLRGRAVVQVDRDRKALGKNYPVDVAVCCDARDAAQAIAGRFTGRSAHRPMRDVDMTVMLADRDASDETGVDPRAAMQYIDGWLPDARVVVADGGHFVEWPSRYLRAPQPGSFRTALAGGSIALALGLGLGIAHLDATKRVAVVIGDGGFFMALSEVETAVRERIPLAIVVVNDRAYSAEVHKLNALGLPASLAYFDDASDVSKVAAGLGASVVRVENISDLEALPDPASLAEPLVVDLRVTRAVTSARLAPSVMTTTTAI